MTKLAVLTLLFIVLAAGTTPGFAAPGPSTKGWTINLDFNDGGINLALAVDNLDELANYPYVVEKTWENMSLGSSGATLKKLVLGIDGDPVVNLNFEVTAGNAPTTFTITSALVSFVPINAEGTATAAITATDNDESGDGTTALGLFPDGKCYQARYNDPTNTTFANLVSSPVVAPSFSSATSSETKPPWQPMGTVYNISSQFKFSLTPNDLASGTSSFRVRTVVPEPGGCAALLCGLFGWTGFAFRRRRA